MIRRSGRVVEGGTLLRCYTSQRGIEGSNPSSSAPKAPRLQEHREDEKEGWERTQPLLHQRSQITLFCGNERRIRKLDWSRGCPSYSSLAPTCCSWLSADLHGRPSEAVYLAPSVTKARKRSLGDWVFLGRTCLPVRRPRESFYHPPKLRGPVAGCSKRTSRVPSLVSGTWGYV